MVIVDCLYALCTYKYTVNNRVLQMRARRATSAVGLNERSVSSYNLGSFPIEGQDVSNEIIPYPVLALLDLLYRLIFFSYRFLLKIRRSLICI